MSARNVEFKAQYSRNQDPEELVASTGAILRRRVAQIDTYFLTTRGRLKMRNTNGECELIYYERLNSPHARESAYLRTGLSTGCNTVSELLNTALGSPIAVDKRRAIFDLHGAIINVDTVENLGRFIEVEVPVETGASSDGALQTSLQISNALALTHADLIPFSYADLLIMKRASEEWRSQLATVKNAGHLYLLDGVSGSGKTSLLYKILEDKSLKLTCVPRHTTRGKRVGEDEPEYIFIDQNEFHGMVLAGEFIEFRDFDFGMSYGLSWDRSMKAILAGHDAVGIIDLGNARHVANFLPEATRILIAASSKTIENRLRARRHHTEEQIQERLTNAGLAGLYREQYHHVIENEDGFFGHSLSQLRDIIRKSQKPARAVSSEQHRSA